MTVWNTLSEINQRLEADFQVLLRLLSEINTPDELLDYRENLTSHCKQLVALIKRNHIYIRHRRQDTLDDVVAITRTAERYNTLANLCLATPIARAAPSDSLSLFVIHWLHNWHDETRKYPAAFIDGIPAIRPFIELPPTPIYYFPFSIQRNLLYQPLFFHEFGHLLYAVHQAEMQDLVGVLQRKISQRLTPLSQRKDGYARGQANYRQFIVDTWYNWVQELFCDAVGLMIGGPSYVYAFSTYLTSVNEMSFYRPPEYLAESEHPVTWLRVQLLTDRMQTLGYDNLATKTRQEWADIAELLDIQEDYHGYFHSSLKDDIRFTIDDMLVEASPRLHTQEEANAHSWSPETDTPVQLMNWAWRVFFAEPQNYPAWETAQIDHLLAQTT